MGRILGIFCAVSLHGLILLFGGLLFLKDDKDKGTLREVELLADEPEQKKEEKKEEKVVEQKEELETQTEEAPDAAELLKNLELSSVQPQPELEAASLSAIADALNGIGGAGDFGEALSFASGGVIGGTGKKGALDDSLEGALRMGGVGQEPGPGYPGAPLFPAGMGGKKVEGVVTVIFVVDANGKVSAPRVESSTHPAFEKPALDAVRQWRFEAAVKGGQRVPCKMRLPIRFQPS